MPLLGQTVRLQDGRLATIQDYRADGTIAVVCIEHSRHNTLIPTSTITK